MAHVRDFADKRKVDRSCETGPPTSAVKFISAVEQRRVAAHREVHTVFMMIPVQVPERRLGPLLSRDAILQGGEQRLPLCVRAMHFGRAHVNYNAGRQITRRRRAA